MRCLTVLGVAAAFVTLAAGAATVNDFARYADYEIVEISPKGTYLAITKRRDGRDAVVVLRLTDLTPIASTTFGDDVDIASVDWVSESRLLIQPYRRFPGFTDYTMPTGEFFGIDADGRNFQVLFGAYAGEEQIGTRVKKRESIFAAGRLVDLLPDDPHRVLIQSLGYGYKGDYNSAYTMDIRNGRLRKVAHSPVRNGTFVTNRNHEVELVYGEDEAGRKQTYVKTGDAYEWRLVLDQDVSDGWTMPIVASDGGYLVLHNEKLPRDGAYLWSPDQPLKHLFSHPEADVTYAYYDPQGRAYMFVAEFHYTEYFYPDPEHPMAIAHRQLVRKFPNENVAITSSTDDMTTIVASVSSPRNPGVFYVIDVPESTIITSLQSRPSLTADMLGEMVPFELKTRDGMKIGGYLTVPPGSNGKALPMIVIPHDGPHDVHDSFGFDPEVQLLANRGYAVLQVNFRGSSGRGREFEAAGYGRWGREMQDDITDAVKWAIADGTADPRRICIFGAHYGGYAALMGAVRDPELYRCAVGYVGVYDLNLMFERGDIQEALRGVNYLKRVLGRDAADLRARSPVHNADKIQAAVLLFHGKLDKRAPIEHSERMADALRNANKRVELITERREAHRFFNEGNRTELYERLLEFFGTHLVVRPAS